MLWSFLCCSETRPDQQDSNAESRQEEALHARLTGWRKSNSPHIQQESWVTVPGVGHVPRDGWTRLDGLCPPPVSGSRPAWSRLGGLKVLLLLFADDGILVPAPNRDQLR